LRLRDRPGGLPANLVPWATAGRTSWAAAVGRIVLAEQPDRAGFAGRTIRSTSGPTSTPRSNTGKASDAASAAEPFGTRRRADRTGFGGGAYRTTPPRSASFVDIPRRHLGLPRTLGWSEIRRVFRTNRAAFVPPSRIRGRLQLRQGAVRRGLRAADCFLNEVIWAYDYGSSNQASAGPGQARRHSSCT